jgi:predicted metal-binding protein
MDLIKEALSMGFANAAIMDTKDLVFVPEYRQFCEDNLCGNYNLVPACPPACGTVEEMHEKAMKYEKALVLQTVLKDPVMDPVLFKQAKHAQNILTEQLAKWMQENGKEDVLIMSAGPYKNCSCMSAYSVDAQKMADAVGMVCWADDSDVRFFTQILFHEDTLDPFYSEQNMASIHKSIQQINDGKIVSKTIDELEQMENN